MNKEKEMQTTGGYDYFAFIYNSKDEAAAKLHRTLRAVETACVLG